MLCHASATRLHHKTVTTAAPVAIPSAHNPPRFRGNVLTIGGGASTRCACTGVMQRFISRTLTSGRLDKLRTALYFVQTPVAAVLELASFGFSDSQRNVPAAPIT